MKNSSKVPTNFNNRKVNNEASNLINQWQENESKAEAKPLPFMKIIVFVLIAWGVFYWFKNG